MVITMLDTVTVVAVAAESIVLDGILNSGAAINVRDVWQDSCIFYATCLSV